MVEAQTSPAVSIILPTYNGSRYLAAAIQSCLDQTFADLELIVVDDCSTDESPKIIAEFAKKDPRVRVVRHEQNKRLPGAINTGMSMSRGRYLTWTSDDNLYRPNAIAEMVDVLEQDPRVGMVYANFALIDDSGNVVGPGFIGPVDSLASINVVGACFLYRREVYDAVGEFDPEMCLVEDWDYWIRVAEKFRLEPLDRDLYLYRHHEGSLTNQKVAAIRRGERKALERHLPRMRWASRRARSRGYLIAAQIAWRFGDRRDAIRLLSRAITQAPWYAITRMLRGPLKRKKWSRGVVE
jgi:glycosyltransferase involved in cell wall biosynthesis